MGDGQIRPRDYQSCRHYPYSSVGAVRSRPRPCICQHLIGPFSPSSAITQIRSAEARRNVQNIMDDGTAKKLEEGFKGGG